jgi:pSer/pThr/pTyr-binding forkhead associated (FHA) protein
MAELWVNFSEENGESGRVRVDGERFAIGRHSSCDLVIPNSKLSREHMVIERSGDRFFASDPGSSNGTEMNSQPLIDRTEIMDGDRANLGGGADVKFEYVWNDSRAFSDSGLSDTDQAAVQSAATTVDAPPTAVAPSANSSAGGFPIWLLITGPLAAIFLLVAGI